MHPTFSKVLSWNLYPIHVGYHAADFWGYFSGEKYVLSGRKYGTSKFM
jgi:hypothetical protein